MSARLSIIFLMLVALLPAPLLGQSLNASIEREVMLVAAGQSSTQNNDKIDWDLKVQRAKGTQHTGRNLLYAGLGVVGGGLLIWTKCSGYDCGESFVGGLFVIGGGGALATVGLVKWRGAKGELELLEREGRAKGYLTVLPSRDGVQAAITVPF